MFERRARAYRDCLSDPKNDTFALLEKDAHDFDGAFIRRSMGSEGEEPEQCLPFYYF